MIQKFFISLAALALAAPPVLALPARSAAQPASVGSIIDHISARNPSLRSFETRMHVQIRQLNFPFLSPHLDGTAYFKQPGKYEVVFDHVPFYAKGFNRFFADIDDVLAWQRDWNIVYSGMQTIGGRSLLALTMTKKIRSDQTKDAIAYIDPSNYEIVRMEWHYFNGGTIAMTQSYRNESGYNVIASQHADISIPHIRAVADSGYDRYQTNVPVSDSVFTKKN